MTESNAGQSKSYIFRMNPLLITALDSYAIEHSLTRSEALRRAIVALTGVLVSTPRKQRSDIGVPRKLKNCPAHGDSFDVCLSHDKTCEDHTCACLIHLED